MPSRLFVLAYDYQVTSLKEPLVIHVSRHTGVFFLRYGSSREFLEFPYAQTRFYTRHTQLASDLHGHACVSSGSHFEGTSCGTRRTEMAFRLYVYACVSSGDYSERTPDYTRCK